MPFLKNLEFFGKKRLHIDQVMTAFRRAFPEHAQAPDLRSRVLYSLRQLEEKDALDLPKSGWDRSGHPSLPSSILLKATIKAHKVDRIDAWVPELSFASMVINPARLELLRRINNFLIRRRGKPIAMVPLAERSLEILGDEKRLMGQIGQDGTLFEGRLPLQLIGAYQVKPPLVNAISKTAPEGSPILILENLATFESFRKWNLKAGAFSGVVWGNGNSLSQGHVSLDDFGMESGGSSFFYFGDLDTHGIEILWRVNRTRNHARLQLLKPHTSLYTWLLDHGVRRSGNGKMHPKHRMMVEEIFTPPTASLILDLWASGSILPQESYGAEQLAEDPSAALSCLGNYTSKNAPSHPH